MKYLFILLISIPQIVFSQNFDNLKKKDLVKVSGGINFNTTYNSSYNNQNERNPMLWNLSGRVNVSILDFSLPFTFSYSTAGSRFTQPFNITSVSPKYKWIQAHIGLTTMNFSQYTLSGRIFLGAGLELTFKKWKIKTMFGRLNKAVEYDVSDNNFNEITYKRLGGAIGITYTNKSTTFETIILKATDLQNSLNQIPLNSSITPKDNLITELKLETKFFKLLDFKTNYAVSFLTENTRLESDYYNSNSLNFIFNQNSSSSVSHMIDASLQFTQKNYSIGIGYKRIDPSFNSLGAYYTNNDLEIYSIKLSGKLLKNKINISGSLGYQRNNIKKESKSKSNRFVTNFALSAALNKKTTLNANYSNFNSTTLGKDNNDPFYDSSFDSLKLFQLNQNANIGLNYRFGTKDKPQNLNFSSNYIQTSQIQGIFENPGFFGISVSNEAAQTNNSVTMLNYSISFKNNELTLISGLNYNINFQKKGTNYFIGPNLSINKKILKKTGSITAGITYNFNKNQSLNVQIISYKFGFQYNPKFWDEKYGKLSFNLNGSYLQRFIPDKVEQQLSVSFGLGYAI